MNKHTISLLVHLFTLLLLHCLYGCGRIGRSYPEILLSADSLCCTHPDSALAVLTAIKANMDKENQRIQMYYQLLYTKAADKAYIPHKSDSIIRRIVNYYERKSAMEYLPETYYYAGRVYSDLGDAPQALDYFQKALETLRTSKDHRLISRIYSQMGTLYVYQRVYDEALSVFKKSYYHDALSADTVGQIYSLRDIGRAFTGCNKADSALFYYESAYRLAQRIQYTHMTSVVAIELAGLYTQLGMYEKAEQTVRTSTQVGKRKNQIPRFSVMADLYLQMGNLDSAAYYYHRLLEFDNYYSKQGGYEGLSKICRQRHQYKEALEYIDIYLAYTDSIKKHTDTETIRKMHSLYNYQLREKENQRLKDINTRQNTQVMGLLFILILSAVSVFSYSQYSRRKKEQKREQQRRLEEEKERQYRKSLQFIEENKKHIQYLEHQLQTSKSEKDQLHQELLHAQKELIEDTNRQVVSAQKEQILSEASLKHSDIYILFHQSAKNMSKVTDADWITLQDAVDKTYQNFSKRLCALYPKITEQEMHVCLLLKISISATGIAHLTMRSKQAVTSSRKKLYEKIHGQQGSPDKLDQFIQDF